MIHLGETIEEGPMLAFFFVFFPAKKEVMVSEGNREKLERKGFFLLLLVFQKG